MPSRRVLTRRLPLAVVLVALLLTGTLAAAAQLWDSRSERQTISSVLPSLDTGREPLLDTGRAAPAPRPDALRSTLLPLLDEPELGGSVSAQVVDAATGRQLFGTRTGVGVAPASTAKLATAVAALQTLGADTVLETRTLLGTATAANTVVLVGGGDATLASPRSPVTTTSAYPAPARLSDLAAATADQLRARDMTTVRIGVDDRLFVGPRLGPGWKPNYVPEGSVTPVSALSVDGGRLDPDDDPQTRDLRAADPALTAGSTFAALLAAEGIRVRGTVARARPSPDADQLGVVRSPPVAALVVRMLLRSDNDLAEALYRHVAIASDEQASFAGGASAVRAALTRAGLDTGGLQLLDGSGLSVRSRVTPRALTALLALVAERNRPIFRPVLEGLPVAAFSGTLSERYRVGEEVDTELGAGVVRAKTGTLTGVSTLAGVVLDADGRLLVFALFATDVPVGGGSAAQETLDEVAGALAACGCR